MCTVRYENKQIRQINKVILSNSGKETKKLYLSSTTHYPGLDDYLEYGFEYWIDKYGHGSSSLLGMLSTETKDVLGTNVEDLSVIEKTLFPTISESGTPGGPDYFGMTTIGDQKITIIEIPPGYIKAELYDGGIDPNIIIEDIDPKVHTLLCITITGNKLGKSSEVNVSVGAWNRSLNSHRNTGCYLLRNDEIKTSIVTVAPLSGTDIWVDTSSDTILGNHTIQDPPIILGKINKYRGNKEWDRDVTYEEGDEVTYLGDSWISIHSGNLGKNPNLSSSWISPKLLGPSFQAERVLVNVPGGGAIVEPEYFTITQRTVGNVEVQVSYLPGYAIGGVSIDGIPWAVTTLESTWEEYLSGNLSRTFNIPTSVLLGKGALEINMISPTIKVTVGSTTLKETYKIGDEVSHSFEYDPNITTIKGITKTYLLGGVPKLSMNLDNVEVSSGQVSFKDSVDKYCDEILYTPISVNTEYEIRISKHVGFLVDRPVQYVKHDDQGIIRFIPIKGELDISGTKIKIIFGESEYTYGNLGKVQDYDEFSIMSEMIDNRCTLTLSRILGNTIIQIE